jgi:hypothetical protein
MHAYLSVIEKGTVERQVKVLIKHLALSFLFSSKKFLPISFKIQLLETSPKTEGTRTKAARCLFFLMSFPFLHVEFFAIFSYCLHFAKFVCLKRLQRLKQEWQKSQAGTWQTYGKNQVWFEEIERKLVKLIKDYFDLLFFLLIILSYQ